MFSKLKEKIGVWLGSPGVAKWLAPFRTFRSKLGWLRTPKPLNKCRRILVIRPDEIGDVVLMSSFLRNLRLSAPKARITVVTNHLCRPVLEYCPYIDALFGLPFAYSLSIPGVRHLVKEAVKLRGRELRGGFDLVLLPRVDCDWYHAELVAHLLAGSGRVVMNSASFIRWSARQPLPIDLADTRIRCRSPQSDSLANLEFLAACGGRVEADHLEFWSSREDEDFAEQWFADHVHSGCAVVFHPPGGHSVLRGWPAGRSREVVEKILAKTTASVVVIGGPEDGWIKEEMRPLGGSRVKIANGTFTLPQLGAVIRRCGYFLGGDSGPMHIAAATGARTIGIFGPGSERRFKPWSDSSVVVSLRFECSPDALQSYEACCVCCMHPENRCLTELSTDRVVSEFVKILPDSEKVQAPAWRND